MDLNPAPTPYSGQPSTFCVQCSHQCALLFLAMLGQRRRLTAPVPFAAVAWVCACFSTFPKTLEILFHRFVPCQFVHIDIYHVFLELRIPKNFRSFVTFLSEIGVFGNSRENFIMIYEHVIEACVECGVVVCAGLCVCVCVFCWPSYTMQQPSLEPSSCLLFFFVCTNDWRGTPPPPHQQPFA